MSQYLGAQTNDKVIIKGVASTEDRGPEQKTVIDEPSRSGNMYGGKWIDQVSYQGTSFDCSNGGGGGGIVRKERLGWCKIWRVIDGYRWGGVGDLQMGGIS